MNEGELASYKEIVPNYKTTLGTDIPLLEFGFESDTKLSVFWSILILKVKFCFHISSIFISSHSWQTLKEFSSGVEIRPLKTSFWSWLLSCNLGAQVIKR